MTPNNRSVYSGDIQGEGIPLHRLGNIPYVSNVHDPASSHQLPTPSFPSAITSCLQETFHATESVNPTLGDGGGVGFPPLNLGSTAVPTNAWPVKSYGGALPLIGLGDSSILHSGNEYEPTGQRGCPLPPGQVYTGAETPSSLVGDASLTLTVTGEDPRYRRVGSPAVARMTTHRPGAHRYFCNLPGCSRGFTSKQNLEC
ncbi:hypothetical protein PM082_017644 [Marasmius tenuissimus]|nr:hypothetical protein PM082_017644 [Marasmius tenuissimus]